MEKEKRCNHNALIKEVFALTTKFCVEDDVECTYFLPYIFDGKKVFDFTVVFKEEDVQRFKYFDELQKNYDDKTEEFGGKFSIKYDISNNYGIAVHSYEVRKIKDLRSSIITYDPTGKYEYLAYQFDRYGNDVSYSNALNFDLVEKEENKVNKENKVNTL